MLYLIAFLLVIVALSAVISLLTKIPPKTLVRAFWWIVGLFFAGFALFLLVTGRGALDVPLGLLFWYLRSGGQLPSGLAQRAKRWFGGSGGPADGGSSAIETAWLRMTLDRASGALDGEVRAGRFAGQQLRRLSLDELRALHADCASVDAQSGRLIEAYLDRLHPGWRDRPAPSSGRMSRDEALQVLGLANGAGPEQIREAHRRLMLKLHPDLGGSDYLAGKINLARDVLLEG